LDVGSGYLIEVDVKGFRKIERPIADDILCKTELTQQFTYSKTYRLLLNYLHSYPGDKHLSDL
jgi:hypothetical protein